MLSRVKIQNFKSIGEPGVDLDLKPLTFLVGPNGGGKSSILEAIGVVAQRSYSGKLVQFASWSDASDGTEVIDTWFDKDSDFTDRLGSSWAGQHGPRTIVPLYGESAGGPEGRRDEFTERFNEWASRLSRATFLLSSIRGDIPHTVGTEGNPDWVGVHGEHLLRLLTTIFGSREFDEKAQRIAEWAGRFGIMGLKAGVWGSNTAGADYLDDKVEKVLNLSLSSSGSRQILTVITQILWASAGSLLLIEEPEISLHPKAQIDVLELFAEAIRDDDKQIIATTHGLFMLQALGHVVQQEWLSPEQIAVWHIEKDENGTHAEQLPINEKGFIEGWIPSFAEVERKLLREAIASLPED